MAVTRSSPVVRLLDGLIEFGWLFILVGVPVFFNVRDYRVFEPDKIVLLRNTILVMAVVFLLKTLYVAPTYLARWFGAGGAPGAPPARAALAALKRRPIVVTALIFAVVYVAATLNSILPGISFWGSYDRLEGTYTYLSYITLFLLIATHLRSWNQVERIITAIILASVPPSAYSWLQHFKDDPLVWADPGQAALRTPSTMGNPIFMAAFLLMAVPFTAYRLVLGIESLLNSDSAGAPGDDDLWRVVGTAGYGLALGLQLSAILFSGSRGPFLGLLAAVFIFVLVVAIRRHVTWLLRAGVAAGVLVLLVLGATNSVYKSSSTPGGGATRFLHLLPSESGTSEVRSLLWKSAPGLLAQRPILGCGPEVLLFCWYSHYPAALRTVELANAAPDRSHDEEIDIALTTGVVGEIAYLAWLIATGVVLARLAWRARDLRSQLLAAALLAAFLGHIVEGATGIAFSATLVMFWTIAALATALDAGDPLGAAGSFARATQTDLPASAAERPAPQEPRPHSDARQSPGAARNRRPARGQPRGAQARVAPSYNLGAAIGRLGGGSLALLGAGVLLALAAIVGCGVLFAGNIQLVLADVDYRQGQNYEQAASSLITDPKNFQVGLQGYQEAISAYQNALNAEPTIDTYSLFLGKTLLEYAAALTQDKTATPDMVTAQVQQALSVFQQAAKTNPLNPDHPRNIAKLYSFWATQLFARVDLSKLYLANQYYATAHRLAPHNADILDEWALLDTQLGNNDTAKAHRWFADALSHLRQARDLFPEDGNVYRDFGPVYAQYAAWAEQAKDTQAAQRYYHLELQAWLTALKYAAASYQSVYPRLAALLSFNLNQPCEAGIYASYGLKAIQQGTLSDPSHSYAAQLQQIVDNATQHQCPANSQ